MTFMRRTLAIATAFLLVASVVPPVRGQSGVGQFELISATPAGIPGGGQVYFDAIPYDHGPQKISADNRYVVFASGSDQLVAGDTNGKQDIFVRDRQAGTTTLVSRAFDGSQSDGDAGTPRISANGRYVTFVSLATNLVPGGDTNGYLDVYARDLQTGTIALASVSSGGIPANYGGFAPTISADGRYIAFQTAADMLGAGPELNRFNMDVFVRDMIAGTTERVSVRPDGSQIIGSDSAQPSISADGRRIAFVVWDNGLLGPTPQIPPNLHHGIYVRDLDTNQTVLVSARPDGTPADHLVMLDPVISANGRYVSFTSWEDLDPNFPDSDLEPDGPYRDVFVRDLQLGVTERVSLPFSGGPDEESGGRATISGNGRYVTYGENRIRDRATGTTTVITTPSGAEPDGAHDALAISEDGQFVYFESYATNVAPNDVNGVIDVFLFSAVATADVSLALTASTVQPAVGTNVALTVTVTNGGPADAADVAVRVTLPPGVTYVSDDSGGAYAGATGVWTAGSLANGSSRTLQIVANVTAMAPATVLAQVSASSITDPDSIPDNDNPAEDDQRSVVLTPQVADLSLTMSANITNPAFNSNVTFTVALTNSGPGTATGVRVHVPMPAGFAFVSANMPAGYDAATGIWNPAALPVGVSIPNGASLTLQIVGRVTSLAAVDVTADISAADQPDPDSIPGNNVAAEDDYVVVRITPVGAAAIVVNNAAMTVSPNDGTCTLVEAIVAANTDFPSGNAIGECVGGNGPDTIQLRALNAPKEVAGVRDEYRVTTIDNVGNGANGLPVITSVITLDGGGAAVARSGASAFRLFQVAPGAALTLNNVAVNRGLTFSDNGGAVVNYGTLEVNHGFFAGNKAMCDGGAIASFGPLIVRASTFELNEAGCSGGAIQTFYAGSLQIIDTTIRNNTAPSGSGGGVMIHGTTTATLTNTTIDSNSAQVDGGGLLAHGGDAHVSFTDSRVTNNVVNGGYGGGIANGRLLPGAPTTVLVAGGNMTITNSVISGNRSLSNGGGIVNASSLTITGGATNGNRVMAAAGFACGGGIFSLDALALTSTLIEANAADGAGRAGGGVCAYVRATVTNTTIRGNTAAEQGGGFALFGPATMTMTGGLVTGNVANGLWNTVGGGGGLAIDDPAAKVALDSVDMTNNRAPAGGNGGAIFNRGTLTITGGALNDNQATSGGALSNGTSLAEGGAVALSNVTMQNNVAASYGGAVFTASPPAAPTPSSVTIAGSMLRNNGAQAGGALFNRPNSTITVAAGSVLDGNIATGAGGAISASGTLHVTGATVSANVAANAGGAIFITATATISGSVITGNVANGTWDTVGGGGGLAIDVGATVSLTGVAMTDNRAPAGGNGGAIFNRGFLTITGGELNDNLAQSGGALSNGTSLMTGGSVTLQSVTLQNNVATSLGGAIFTANPPAAPAPSLVTVRATTLRDNRAVDGGAIFSRPNSNVDIRGGSVVNGNTASARGGALHISGALNVEDTTFSSNAADAGGAIYTSGPSTIAGSTIRGNTAAQQGGGIVIFGAATLAMTGGAVSENVANGKWFAVGGGGGLAITDPAANVTLTGVAVSNNRAPSDGDGGGIFNRGTLAMVGGTIAGNTALSGAGLANGSGAFAGGAVTLTNTIVENNEAVVFGGGLFTSSILPHGTISITGGAVRNNRARDAGGIHSSGTLTITRATIANNTAAYAGGIVSNGQTTITLSTVSGNSADRIGGLGVMPGTTARIENATVSGNTATTLAQPSSGGLEVLGMMEINSSTIAGNTGSVGGILNQGHVIVANSIVAGNRRSDATSSECLIEAGAAAIPWTFVNNLVGEDAACGIAVNLNLTRLVPSDTVFTDVLAPLTDNGGVTETHALLPGSLAIDGIVPVPPMPGFDCPARDQRGDPRGRDGDGNGVARCDIGAFEQQTTLPAAQATITTLTPSSVPGGAAGVAVEIAGSKFVSSTQAFVNGVARTTFPITPSRLRLVLEAADVAVGADLRTVLITVENPGTAASNALPLTVVSANVALVQSALALGGTSTTATILPMAAGQAGVMATLNNHTPGSSAATISVATYLANPAGGLIFAAGGFFDLQVTGADASDSVAARFYYPTTVVGAVEATLQLQYWTGAAWAPVIGSAGAIPDKNTTDNLDATVSGGRFMVAFDNSSTPRITELGGTVFALAAIADADPPITMATHSPAANASGWNNTDVTVSLAATDAVSEIAQIEFNLNDGGWQRYIAPIAIRAEGVHTLRYRSRDAAGNLESIKTHTIRIDTTAPSMVVSVTPTILWPANHQLIDVKTDVKVTDALSPGANFTLVSVESSEPDDDRGDGHTAPDMVGWEVGTADTRGKLRAERSGRGKGRVYTLKYQGIDRAGNVATTSVTVVVPRDGRR
jgi:uncharacterized repeat protein (TIGR01451 family)